MNISFVIRKLIPILLLLALVTPIAAQDDPQPTHSLLEMLAYVPTTDDVSTEIYYSDFLASAETVLGEKQESSHQAWEALGYPDDMWIGWIPYASPPFIDYFISMLNDGGQATGLDVSTIERSLHFGQPPSLGLILQGDFDNEAIVTTLTPNTHELQPRDDVTLLCSFDGCEDGLTQNIRERDVVNPFGGNLGRREPIALLDGLILNSPDINVVEAMLQTGTGAIPSLADSPDYQAAVLVAAQQGVLRQALFLNLESRAVGDFDDIASGLLPEEQKEAVEDLVTPLPPYDLIMIADTGNIDAGTQAGLVLLVYDTEEDATAALNALQTNLAPDGIVSFWQNRPLYTMMTERGDIQFEVITHEPTGRYIALLSLQAPLVGLPNPEEVMPISAGLQFHLFLNMVIARDTLWLAHETESE